MLRLLSLSDYYKEYIPLLQQLSPIKSLSYDEFRERFFNIQLQNTKVVVIEHQNKIIASGNIFIEQRFGDCIGHIECVVVDKEHRNKRYGAQIVQELIKEAKNAKCYRISLYCKEENVGFYEKQGLVKTSVEMRKILN